MIRIHNQTTPLHSSLPTICPECAISSRELQLDGRDTCNNFAASRRPEVYTDIQHIFGTKLSVSVQETSLPKALGIHLSQTSDPTGLKVKRWGIISVRAWSVDLRIGPAIVRYWSATGKPVYKTTSWKQGICLSSNLKDYRLFSRRITLTIFGIVRAPKISITCNLSICGMLRVNNPAYLACQKGDWLLLRNLLQNGKVKITDSTGFGDTLLHVCPLL